MVRPFDGALRFGDRDEWAVWKTEGLLSTARGDPYQGPPGKWGPKGASELVYLPVVEGC